MTDKICIYACDVKQDLDWTNMLQPTELIICDGKGLN